MIAKVQSGLPLSKEQLEMGYAVEAKRRQGSIDEAQDSALFQQASLINAQITRNNEQDKAIQAAQAEAAKAMEAYRTLMPQNAATTQQAPALPDQLVPYKAKIDGVLQDESVRNTHRIYLSATEQRRMIIESHSKQYGAGDPMVLDKLMQQEPASRNAEQWRLDSTLYKQSANMMATARDKLDILIDAKMGFEKPAAGTALSDIDRLNEQLKADARTYVMTALKPPAVVDPAQIVPPVPAQKLGVGR